MSSIDQSLGRAAIGSSRSEESVATLSLDKSAASKISVALLATMSVISALLVPSRMLLSTGESDDSSVFAYMGWGIRHGLKPYRDIWDHKGPLLYYLQVAGLSLSPNSTFGIGLLELIALVLAFFFVYRVIASFASRFVSIAVAALAVVFVTHFNAGGNMTESWALLPLAAAQYAAWRWSQETTQDRWAAVLGMCFACICGLRPNMAAYPAIATIVVVYAVKKNQGFGIAMRQFALACAGALATTLLMVAPLFRWGVFQDFVAAYFGYNGAYSHALALSTRVMHTRELLIQLFAAGIAILGTAGWAFALKERKQSREKGISQLYLQTLLWSLPFEVAGATLSGRDYGHYLLPLFPTLAVLAAWFASALESLTRKTEPARLTLVTALLAGLLPLSLAAYSKDFAHSTEPPRSDYLAVARFIQHSTGVNDKITVVGGTEAAYISFLAQRLPGSRFVYQYALVDSANPSAFDQRKQFVCDLAVNRPAVIVSGNPLLGILCSSELECALRNMQSPVSDYGYQTRVLPKLLQDMVANEYRAVPDPRFGDMRVLLRKDIAIPTQW